MTYRIVTQCSLYLLRNHIRPLQPKISLALSRGSEKDNQANTYAYFAFFAEFALYGIDAEPQIP